MVGDSGLARLAQGYAEAETTDLVDTSGRSRYGTAVRDPDQLGLQYLVVSLTRLERVTSSMSTKRSGQLSYRLTIRVIVDL